VSELAQVVDTSSEIAGPLVSIGLPVFNGERYVASAIESILGQSYSNFELIIGDNASTDRTGAICEAFARKDSRVRYVRNERNLGAGPNYDRCFHRARGTYFKWAAHDDMLAPQFLEKAVAALEANPKAVLCTVGIAEIDADGKETRTYRNVFPAVESGSARQRFASLIHVRHQCEDFFGLYRRAALVGSGLHSNYTGSDRVLLAEMALRGPWVSVNEPLFLHREHGGRYTRAVLLADRKAAALWQDTTARRKMPLYHPAIYRRYWGLVGKTALPWRTRLGCYGELARWWFTDNHLRATAADVLLAIHPGALFYAQKVKRFFFGISTHPADLPPLGS
jgi:glycosyltransferase involved in cell wall biosynthesis